MTAASNQRPEQQVMLSIRDLEVAYGDFRALTKVDLTVNDGEFVCILGPSGCGKSTLLNVIAGFADITSGSIEIDGKEAADTPANRRPTAMVFQSYALFPHMTVFENVAFGLRLRKLDSHLIATKVREALELVKLSGVEERYPRQLSGGQQQRVALARALVVEPKLMLLDEPFSNIDAKLREWVRVELKQLQRKIRTTMIFVTHDQEEAFELGDRVVLMNGGRVEQVGTASDLYSRPESLFAAGFIGRSNILQGVVRTHDGDRATIEVVTGETLIGINVRGCAQPAGTRVSLIVRPEQVSLDRQYPGDENFLDGTVRLITDLGSDIRYLVTVGEHEFVVMFQNANQPKLAEGQQVRLSFGPDLRTVPADGAGEDLRDA